MHEEKPEKCGRGSRCPTGAGRSVRLHAEHHFEVVGVPACLKALVVQARLGEAFPLEQVQADAAKDGEVLRPVAPADAAVVLPEGHVEQPVEIVLDQPVGAHLCGTGVSAAPARPAPPAAPAAAPAAARTP